MRPAGARRRAGLPGRARIIGMVQPSAELGAEPVIGGSSALHEAVASMPSPPPETHSPGVGNLSGLVLMLAISAGLVSVAYHKFAKMQRKSNVHSKAQRMANALKAKALSTPAESDPTRGNPKTKKQMTRSKGSKCQTGEDLSLIHI